MKKLNWEKLKDNRCPKRKGLLNKNLFRKTIDCTRIRNIKDVPTGCDFSISEERFNEVVNSLYRGRYLPTTEKDNQADLNNL